MSLRSRISNSPLWSQFVRSMSRTGYPWANTPGRHATAEQKTARCAGGCGIEVALSMEHVTVASLVEREMRGGFRQSDDSPLAYFHLRCWPTGTDPVTLTIFPFEPDRSWLAKDGAR